MAENIEEQYYRILEQSRINGEILDEPQGQERRNHPRLKVETDDLWINTIQQFSIIDMSLSGIAILSNHPLRPGELLQISMSDTLNADAEVVACKLEDASTEFLDAQFRIQCKFVEEYKGMELIVTIKSKPN
ncbi:MAG: PilZ domain-containing protein [SAR324 cluster bacterium]|nr:PilZ domain-containing protein [SAR324 cluster bacterium]MCZ6626821.1 PilZ domain-containing protein [SAR324 cluster bacterium]